jgi:hypothetical protein
VQYVATITAWDLLDRVNVSVRMVEYDHLDPSHHEMALAHESILQGEGVSDPSQWLSDVLIWLLETL